MDRGELFSVQVDLQNLVKRSNRYVTEFGMGEKEVLVNQGRLLMKDISDASPPKNLSKAKEKANKQVRRSFYCIGKMRESGPVNLFPEGSAKAGHGETRWLYAGGDGITNFVVGVDRAALSAEKQTIKECLEILKERKKRVPMERFKNSRGTHVMIVKSPIISRTMFNRLVIYVKERYGRLKASWVKAAAECGCGFQTDGWVQKHVAGAKGGGFVMLNQNEGLKSLTFISSADGVQSDASWRAIRAGIHGRAAKVAADIRNIERMAYKRAGFANAK